jgi:hypothetical protein
MLPATPWEEAPVATIIEPEALAESPVVSEAEPDAAASEDAELS